MMFADKLIQTAQPLPTGFTAPPSSYTTQTIVDLSNTANYQQGVFADSGWYRVKIGASDGTGPVAGERTGGKGGYASKIFYAYSGTKYIIWGCNGNYTGYPNPISSTTSTGLLGGNGGNGRSYGRHVGQTVITSYGGGGGGSPTGNTSSFHHAGGAGAGFICGLDELGTTTTTQTMSYVDGDYVNIPTVTTMVLAAGGGGQGQETNTAYQCTGGGGGGGAWGNGGNGGGGSGNAGGTGGTGPGGATSGYGANGSDEVSTGGAGGDGGWAILDYTTNTFTGGRGANGRPAAQVCVLEKLIY